jgi:maleate isomerase
MTNVTTTLERREGAGKPGEGDGLLANFERLSFAADGGVGVRASLGLLVLETDQTVEWEFRCLLPAAGVALYEARLHNDAVITPDSLKAMELELAPAARLLPQAVDLSAIGYACTSGSMIMGEDVVSRQIRGVRPSAKISNPVSAALAAFRALKVSRVALLTPYLAEINLSLRANFQRLGLSIPVMGSFNEPDDNVVARISTASIRDAILKIGRSEACEGVFVSCTSLRVAEIAAGLEAELGKPVTSSNHALAWHMLRLAGIDDAMPQHGRLFTKSLAAARDNAT